MKLNTKFLFVVVFLFATALSSHSFAANIIPNPGFELGSGDNFDNWSKWNGASSLLATTVDGEFRSGERALKAEVTVDGQAWHVQFVSDLIQTIVGESYTFKVWVKAATAGTTIRFSTNPSAMYSGNYTVTTEWTELSWTFTANESQTRIVLDLGANANTYFLDDMDMQEPITDAPNIIPNPGFELGSGDDFDNWSKWNGATSLLETTVAGEYRSGSRALKAIVAADGNPWSVQMVSDLIPTIVGETYTFKVYVKAVVAGTSIRFSTNPSAMYSGNYTVTTDWTQLRWTFTANEPQTRMVLDLGANANTYFLDDMEMLEPVTTIDNLLLNAGFELGSGDNFNNWGKWNGASSLIAGTASGEYRSGSRGLKAVVATDGNPWNVQMVSDPVPTVLGASYTFKIHAKALTGGTTIRFSTNPNAQYSANYTITDDWTELSWTIVANATATRMVLDLGAHANTYYLDDASLEILCGVTEYTPPADQVPIAEGKNKFLGTIYKDDDPHINKYFNQIAPENEGKWGSIETEDGIFNWTNIDAARQFASENNFPFRFHVLVWGRQQPTWLKPLSDAEKVLRVKRWFQNVAEHFNGSSESRAVLDYLEVVNEPLHAPPDNEGSNADRDDSGDYLDALRSLNVELGTTPGEYDWIVNAFKLARQYFPCETKLMINDYGIENGPENAANYVEIIELLKTDDLIDAVGMQCHSFSTRQYGTGPIEDVTVNLENNLNTISSTGLPIMVTELDIDGNVSLDEDGNRVTTGTDEEKDEFQRSEYERIFGLYWNHPSVIGITLWGYRMGMWRSEQAAYTIEPCVGAERPAMSAYLNTVVRNGGNPPLNPLFAPILEVTPILTLIPEEVQFSDKSELKVQIQHGASRCGFASESATFTLSNGTTTFEQTVDFIASGKDIEAFYEIASFVPAESLILEPGTYEVLVTLNDASNPNYDVAAITPKDLVVTEEDARVTYTGPTTLAATQGTADASAVVTLRATIQDISATPDADGDVNSGDIRLAEVRFLDNETPIIVEGLTDANGWILEDINLVDQTDLTTGIVSLEWPLTIPTDTEVQLNIGTEVSGFYSRKSAEDDIIVTVYEPQRDLVAGLGSIEPIEPAGAYAPNTGKKVIYGILAKYNSSGDRLFGVLSILYSRTVDEITSYYSINSYSVTSLGVNTSIADMKTAVLVADAKLTDVTQPFSPVTLAENLSLQLDLIDKGEPGDNDEMAISLFDGNELLFSSNWQENLTIADLLFNGNIIIYQSNCSEKSGEEYLASPYANQFGIEVWPNPTQDQFNLSIQSENLTDVVELYVYDSNGKCIQSMKESSTTVFTFGSEFQRGLYIVEIRQGNQRSIVHLIKE